MVKYIFVTGGVVSGLGKGITAASLGRLLKQRGLKVVNQKFDPYINVDPSNISPFQHGEVYVTGDGAETDLDIGHYERFIDEDASHLSNITTGKVYLKVLERERNNEYGGKTVQIVPHITNEIKSVIFSAGSASPGIDVVITEIGGTVGDIESTPFLEAIRQLPFDVGRENVLYIHVTLIPFIEATGELKTKPTQHSVKTLQSVGITPDIIVCRTDHPLEPEGLKKLGMFCNVTPDAVIQNLNAPNLYQVPLMLEKEGLGAVVCRKLNLPQKNPDLEEWRALVSRITELSKTCVLLKIALVGKYVEMHDAYISIAEALRHAGYANNACVHIEWLSSGAVNGGNIGALLGNIDGIVAVDAYSQDGEMAALPCVANYARLHDIPYFGIGLGMHAAVIEYARSVCGATDADSAEFNPKTNSAVVRKLKSGALRKGSIPVGLKKDSLAAKIYGTAGIFERYRQLYEINPAYFKLLEDNGMCLSGMCADTKSVGAIEIPGHKWFLAVQYHPEFKSRPTRPHPLFASFVKTIADSVKK